MDDDEHYSIIFPSIIIYLIFAERVQQFYSLKLC